MADLQSSEFRSLPCEAISCVLVEHSTSVCQTVGSKVMTSIPHVAENMFGHIYSQKI